MDDRLLELLACPACKGSVAPDKKDEFLVCWHCKLKYPVIDHIPVMLVDEARSLSEDDDG